jgi:cell division protein FtsI (penicillin-binding protein 3)
MNNNYIAKILDIFSKGLFSWDHSDNAVKFRIFFVLFFFLLLFLVIIVKLIIVSSGDYNKNTHSYLKHNDYNRLDIVDRNNNLLAVNLPIASLFANPKRVVDAEVAVEKLLKIFPDLDKKYLLENLKSDKTFVWIKRDITPKEQEKIYNLGMPGFEFEKEQKRVYTYGKLFSHVIGYVDRDMQGLAGIEKYFNDILKGNNNKSFEISSNKQIQLSLDVRIQNIVSEELDKVIAKFNAIGGAGIVADPNSGEILALVSKPDFDPHNPSMAKEDELFNIAAQGVYEMGSGMKSLTMAIGFDTDIITMHDVYDLSFMKVGKFQIKDTHPAKGWHSIPEIFMKSSNVGVSQIILEIGKHKLREYLKKLNLLDKLNIELPERARPLFPNFSRWNDLSLVTMSYGYAISESPVHFVQSMIPAVNGGVLYPVTLIKKSPDERLIGERVFKKETSNNMRKLMRLVVAEGTGRKAEVKGHYVGGKTGTAEKAISGRYDKSKRISSFFGIMPAYNPKYVIYLVIDEPKGIKETYGFAGGGWTAAPTVGAILQRIATVFAMSPALPESPEVQEINNIQYRISNET